MKERPGMDNFLVAKFFGRWQSDGRSILRDHGVDALCVMMITTLGLAIGISHIRVSYDDAFITYRYAYNLATGHGFVYNVGEHYLGTTAPLYALILGILGLFNPDAIPLLGGIFSVASLLATGIALYMYGRLHDHRLGGFLAGLFFVVDPFLPTTFGGEMLFTTALIAWSFVSAHQNSPLRTAILVALAVLTRPDSLIAAGVLGIYIYQTQHRLPWRECLAFASFVLPFLLLARLYYGAFLPGTLDSKVAQAASGMWPPFAQRAVPWASSVILRDCGYFPAKPLEGAMAACVVLYLELFMAVRYRCWLLPLSWVGLYGLTYSFLEVAFYPWHAVPLSFGLAILMALGVTGIVDLMRAVCLRLARNQKPMVFQAAFFLCLLVVGYHFMIEIWQQADFTSPQATPRQRIYIKAARWLAANTPLDAKVGYLEIGWLGYYSHRPIVDGLGLIHPGVDVHIAHRNFLWAYQYYSRPDYILYNENCAWLIGTMKEKPWFKQEYREVTEITQEGHPPLEIYQRFHLLSAK